MGSAGGTKVAIPASIERALDPLPQVARDVVAPIGIDARDGPQRDRAARDLLDPGDARRIEQGVGPGGIVAERLGRLRHRPLGAVGVAPRDLDVDRDPSPGARQVGHLRDLAVRDDVQRTRASRR